jgi:hypothetical protein
MMLVAIIGAAAKDKALALSVRKAGKAKTRGGGGPVSVSSHKAARFRHVTSPMPTNYSCLSGLIDSNQSEGTDEDVGFGRLCGGLPGGCGPG